VWLLAIGEGQVRGAPQYAVAGAPARWGGAGGSAAGGPAVVWSLFPNSLSSPALLQVVLQGDVEIP
jgi:hypothetical protein